MRLLLRLLIIVPLALIGAAVVAVIVVVVAFDPNDYRGAIENGLRDATKQPVALRGPLRWSFGFTPTVSIEDVVIGDPDAPAASNSLRVGKLEVAVDLIPLIRERLIRITSLTLNDVALVVDLRGIGGSAARATAPVAGQPPPATPPPQPEAAPPAPPAQLPEIVEMSVRNASITVRDRARDRAWQLVLTRAAITRQAPALEIDAEGSMNDTAFTVQGTVGVLAMLSAGTWPVDLTIRSALGQMKLAGSIVDTLATARPDLTLSVEGPELQSIAALAGVTTPPLGPFRGEIKLQLDQALAPTVPALSIAFGRPALMRVQVQGSVADPLGQRGFDLRVTVEGQEIGALSAITVPGQPALAIPALGPFQVQAHVVDGPALDDLRVQVGRDNGVKLVVAGSIREPLARRGFALDVQLQAPDVQALARLAQVDTPLRGVVAFQARLSDPAPNRVRFENLRATLGPNDATGDVTVTLDGARPTIAGELAANRIDLVSLGVGAPRGGAARSDRRVFSDSPLPFDRLTLADADLQLRAARIDGSIVALRNAVATIALRDGEMTVRPWSVELGGGTATGEFTAASRGAIAVRANVRGFNAGALLREAQLSDKLDGGRGEFTLDLRGTGRSMRTIMATANGSETLIVRGGTVDSRFFEIIGADLVRWIGQMVRGAERPTLNCAITRFDMWNGLATARVLMFDTSQMTAAGEGTINLASEALALRIQPRPRDASLLSFAVPLEVAGTLSRPTFLPNSVGAVGRTATAVGANVVLGPIGAIMSIANIGQGRDDPCTAATALAQGQAPERAAPAQRPSQNPIDQLGDGIGRGLRGIFGR